MRCNEPAFGAALHAILSRPRAGTIAACKKDASSHCSLQHTKLQTNAAEFASSSRAVLVRSERVKGVDRSGFVRHNRRRQGDQGFIPTVMGGIHGSFHEGTGCCACGVRADAGVLMVGMHWQADTDGSVTFIQVDSSGGVYRCEISRCSAAQWRARLAALQLALDATTHGTPLSSEYERLMAEFRACDTRTLDTTSVKQAYEFLGADGNASQALREADPGIVL